MLSAGIDIGAKTIKIVVLADGEVLAREITPAGYDVRESMEKAWAGLAARSGVTAESIGHICGTGAGRKDALHASDSVSDVTAAAKGAHGLDPSIRTVIDVGAEEARAISLNKSGKVLDFAINEKCAAGSGAFTEAMARALEVGVEELGPLSLQSTKAVPINAQCVVFAESEIVTLVHSKTPKPDMARAIHDAIAERVVSMVRRVGLEPEVMLIGGLAKNVGFLTSLERELGIKVIVPEHPEFVGALGAAWIASEL